MTLIRFPEWRPDIAPLDGGGLTVVNALPKSDGYCAAYGPSVINPGVLTDRPLLLVAAKSSDGTTTPLAFCANKTYRASLSGWNVCDGSVLNSTSWDAVAWGDSLYCVNGGPAPLQKVNLLSGAGFTPVDTPNGLTGRSIAVIADFLAIFYIVELNGARVWPYRGQWSGIQRPESFAPSKVTQADYQDFQDIGQIRRGTGGEFGLVLGSNGLARMDYIGPPDIFRISTLENNIGCDIPQTVIRSGDKVIWWSRVGWRISSGGPSSAIGNDVCDRWFRERLRTAGVGRISTTVLPNEEIAVISFPSTNSNSDDPDEILYYDFATNKFSPGKWQEPVQCIGRSVQASPLTDDDLQPPDNMPSSGMLTDDYQILTDGFGDNEDFPAAIVGGKLARLDKGANVAILRTPEVRLGQSGQKTTLLRFEAMVHGAQAAEATVYARDTQADPVYRSVSGLQPLKGRYKTRVKAHYHAIELKQLGDFERAIGVDIIETVQDGGR